MAHHIPKQGGTSLLASMKSSFDKSKTSLDQMTVNIDIDDDSLGSPATRCTFVWLGKE
jgi:hypothetical protein